MTKLEYVTCLLLLLMTSRVKGQGSNGAVPQGELHPSSPCPRVFTYENDRTWNTRWYGTALLSVPGNRPFNITIKLNRKADLLGTWAGTVISDDNENFILLHPSPSEEPSLTRVSVRFFVNFPRGGPVPRVVSIRRDSIVLCGPGMSDNTNHPGVSLSGSSAQVQTTPSTLPTRPPTRPTSAITRPSRPTPVPVFTQGSTPRPPPPSNTVSSLQRPNTRPPVFGPATTSNPWTITRPTTSSTTIRPISNVTPLLTSFPDKTSQVISSENCGTIDIRSAPFLVNPQSGTTHGEWPWHVAIYSTASGNQKYICGGTLVSRRAIITAGHCVTNPNNGRQIPPDQLIVYLGKHSLPYGWTISEGIQTFTPDRIIRHPTYDRSNTTGDIAMILLPQDAQITSYVRLICLWPRQVTNIRDIEGHVGVVVGWGFDSSNKPTPELQRVNLKVRSYEECIRSNRDFFSRFLVEKTFCAGYRNGTSACNGDSGGGMVFQRNERWYLRGIVSNGVPLQDNISLCNPEHYTVFVDAAQYQNWIEQNDPDRNNVPANQFGTNG